MDFEYSPHSIGCGQRFCSMAESPSPLRNHSGVQAMPIYDDLGMIDLAASVSEDDYP